MLCSSLLTCFLSFIEQQCFELDTQLQQLQQHRQQDENVIHELSESKSRADAELTAVKEELVSLRIQFSS